MKKYFRLPFQIILHNKLYWMLVLVIVFSTAFLGTIENVSKSMSEDVFNEQRSIYGGFQFVAYVDGTGLGNHKFGAEYAREVFPDKQIQFPGYIYKLGYAEIEGFTVDFGYLDDQAWNLSEAKFIKGELPKQPGQVALADTKISELSSVTKYDVGSNIEVNGKTFTISGIYEEFGARWIGSNSFRFFSEVDGIFSKKETEQIWNRNHSKLLTILMNESDLFSNEEIQDAKNIFSNIYITEEYAKNMYQLPAFIIPSILLMNFLLIGSILLLIGKQRAPINAIYLQLGLGQFRLIVIQSVSFLICYIAGMMIGILGIYMLTRVLVGFQNVTFTVQDVFINWNIIVIIVLYLIVMTLLFFGFEKKLNSSSGKASLKKFSRGSFILSKSFCLSIFACSMIILWEYNITSVHQYKYEKEHLPISAGEMDVMQNIGYDFELLSVNTTTSSDNLITNSIPDDGSGIYFYNNYMHFGIGEDQIREFDSLEGISHTKYYKENDTAMLHINGDQVSDYIDACDFTKDGKYIPRTLQYWENSILEYYGLEEKLLVNSKILGCEDEDLIAVEKYLANGSVNLDKLMRGEEVILIAPRFSLTRLSENQTLMKRMLPGRKDDNTYFMDSSFSVGDTITFYVLQPKDTKLSFGAVAGSNIIDDFELVTREAKIGAIVYDYAGWFSHDKTAKPYTLVVNNKAFTDWGLEGAYTRLRIYTNENADESNITKLIYKTYRDIDSPMEIENKMRSERLQKKYLYFLQTVKYIFTLLSAIAFFTVSGINVILQIFYHKKSVGLLFLNGLTLHRLFIDLEKMILKVWIISMFAFSLSFYLIMSKEMQGITPVVNLILPGILILIVQLLALLPCYYYLKKSSIIQLLK